VTNGVKEKHQFKAGLLMPSTKAEAAAELTKVRDAKNQLPGLEFDPKRREKLVELLERAEQLLLRFSEAPPAQYRTELGLVMKGVEAFDAGKAYYAPNADQVRGEMLKPVSTAQADLLARGDLEYLMDHFDKRLRAQAIAGLIANARFRPSRIEKARGMIEERIAAHPEDKADLGRVLDSLQTVSAAKAKVEAVPTIGEIMEGLDSIRPADRYNAAPALTKLLEAEPGVVASHAEELLRFAFSDEQKVYFHAFGAISAVAGMGDVADRISKPLLLKWTSNQKDAGDRARKLLDKISVERPSSLLVYAEKISKVAVDKVDYYQFACVILGRVAVAEPLSQDVRNAVAGMLEAALDAPSGNSGRYLDFRNHILWPLLHSCPGAPPARARRNASGPPRRAGLRG